MQTYLHKLSLIALAITSIFAARAGDQAVPVMIQNFPRAETDLYFGRFVKEKGLGKLGGSGEVTPIARVRKHQTHRGRPVHAERNVQVLNLIKSSTKA